MREAALLSGAALSAAVLTACNGGATESGGMDGFRAFARQIDEAVASGDGTLLEQQVASGGVDFWTGDVGILGAPRERARSAFEHLVSEALTGESDEFGGGEARSFAIAKSSDEPRDEERYQAILSAIVPLGYEPGSYRTVQVYEFGFRGDRWVLVTVIVNPHAGLSVYPFAGAWLRGECDICFDHWERWEGTP